MLNSYSIHSRHGCYLKCGPCVYSSTPTMIMENPRTKAKLGQERSKEKEEEPIGQVTTDADQEVQHVESPKCYSGQTSGQVPYIRHHQVQAKREGPVPTKATMVVHLAPSQKSGTGCLEVKQSDSSDLERALLISTTSPMEIKNSM
jgi:hypothetical protein